jgi:uncharacterized protein involved in outer membrane biogenesis
VTGPSQAAPPTGGRRGGILLKLLMLLAGLAAFVALIWMMFLPALIAQAVEERTGFGVRIERLAVNPFTARVAWTGLALDNPAAYPSRDFVQLRAFRADAQLFTLFRERPVFDDVAIDVALVAVVKQPDGVTNLDQFRSRLAKPGALGGGSEAGSERPRTPVPPTRPAKNTEFLIKRLEIRFERLTYTDLTAARPATREYNLGFSHRYTDVSDPTQLLVPALFRSVGESGGLLEGLLPARVELPTAERGSNAFRDAGRKASDGLKSLFRALEDSRKP